MWGNHTPSCRAADKSCCEAWQHQCLLRVKYWWAQVNTTSSVFSETVIWGRFSHIVCDTLPSRFSQIILWFMPVLTSIKKGFKLCYHLTWGFLWGPPQLMHIGHKCNVLCRGYIAYGCDPAMFSEQILSRRLLLSTNLHHYSCLRCHYVSMFHVFQLHCCGRHACSQSHFSQWGEASTLATESCMHPHRRRIDLWMFLNLTAALKSFNTLCRTEKQVLFKNTSLY